MKLQGMKHTMVAAVLALVVAMVGQAQAFQFDEGDTVLAIWGNGTEALYNLSNTPSFGYGAGTQSINVGPGLTAAGGANPIRFSLFSSDANAGVLTSGTSRPGTQLADPSILFSQVANWAPQSAFAGDTILAANENSFTQRIGLVGGADAARVLNGTWDGDVFGSFDNIAGGSNVMQVFRFELGSAPTVIGHLRMSQVGLVEWQRDAFGGPPVPVPAAVWLFGTGLVGLAGLARRRRQAVESLSQSDGRLVI
ncbi:MAG TPA: hypothetical protein DDY39_10250 [Nitrospira sp.]|nr:hypothetical protein [Nitrospira sp.]HBR48916.1 hypothetical protein [Nitrospira sp.]